MSGNGSERVQRTRSRRVGMTGLIVAGLAVAFVLAFFVSPHASSSPDGLEKVAADKALDTGEKPHAFADGPFSDYAVKGVDDPGLSTGLAGLVGVSVTFVAGVGLFALLKLGRSPAQAASST